MSRLWTCSSKLRQRHGVCLTGADGADTAGRMPQLTICPNCHMLSFDQTASVCRACGMRGSTRNTVDETLLAGLLHNVQLRLTELAPHEFQQIIGVLGPRLGQPDDDGVPFTDETCRITQQYMVDCNIHCARIDLIADRVVSRSLVVAHSQFGIERCLRQARKLALQTRTRVMITYAVKGATQDAARPQSSE